MRREGDAGDEDGSTRDEGKDEKDLQPRPRGKKGQSLRGTDQAERVLYLVPCGELGAVDVVDAFDEGVDDGVDRVHGEDASLHGEVEGEARLQSETVNFSFQDIAEVEVLGVLGVFPRCPPRRVRSRHVRAEVQQQLGRLQIVVPCRQMQRGDQVLVSCGEDGVVGKNDPESVHCSGLRNVMKRRPCVPVCAVDLGSPLEEEVCNGGVTHDYSDMQRRVLHVPSFLLDICACIEQPNHFCDVVVEHCRIERWKGRHKAFVPCPVTVSFIVFFRNRQNLDWCWSH